MPFRDKDWMWAEACELIDRAERLHRQFFRLSTSTARRPAWQPPVDIMENDEAILILLALPGVPPDQIQIGMMAGMLVVAGERPLPVDARGAAIHRLEIPHGRFERRVELPPGEYELERQELAHGCLLLRLRKQA